MTPCSRGGVFSPQQDAEESATNATAASSRRRTEPSANDFQDFVSEMQKTITSLRKQVSWYILYFSVYFQHCQGFVGLFFFKLNSQKLNGLSLLRLKDWRPA